ncbi:MAG: hypothetical protein ACJAT6_000384, partial [Akkermansiaceae bacterium]
PHLADDRQCSFQGAGTKDSPPDMAVKLFCRIDWDQIDYPHFTYEKEGLQVA